MLTPSAEDSLTRRRFLAQSATGSSLLLSSLAPMTFAAEGEPLKLALVGCGGRGAGAAAQALSTGIPVKLWAMADAFRDRLDWNLSLLKRGAAGEYGVDKGAGFGTAIDVPPERQFIGLDAYRKAIDSGVDVVILTGPPGFRPQHFEYAVNAGKHVFMEKPVATDSHGIRRVFASAQVARAKNLKIGVGLQRHHDPVYLNSIQKIHDGEIGRIMDIRVYWNGGLPAKQPFPRENLSELEYQVRNWYYFNWLSGDHIVEQHIHNIDVGNWIAQATPVSAEGMGGRQVRTGKEFGNIYDHHCVEFTYADGRKMFSQCRQMSGCDSKVVEYVEATEGNAEFNGQHTFLSRGEQKLWRPSRRLEGIKRSPYQVEHDVLFNAIVNDRHHNEVENGACSTLTAIMGRMATYSGKKITWECALNSKHILTTDAETWTANAPVLPNEEGGYDVAVPGVSSLL